MNRYVEYVVPQSLNCFWVSIDGGRGGEDYGRFQNCYMEEAVSFGSLVEFFQKADEMMDSARGTVEYPQAQFELRSFGGDHTKKKRARGEDQKKFRAKKNRLHNYYSEEELRRRFKMEHSFFIQVLYRFNGSWQGNAVYSGKKTKQPMELQFRSALELMLAMQELIEQGKGAEECLKGIPV